MVDIRDYLQWLSKELSCVKKNYTFLCYVSMCVWREDQYPINYIQCSIFDQSDNILTNKYFLDLGTSLICPNKFPLNTLHWIEWEYLETLQIYQYFANNHRTEFFSVRFREIIFWNLLGLAFVEMLSQLHRVRDRERERVLSISFEVNFP